MAKPTQAHMSKTIDKNKSTGMRDMAKRQMEYYMGAKLIEIGIDPKSAIYRWSVEPKGSSRELWTYSAYWGDSKETLLQQEQNASTSEG